MCVCVYLPIYICIHASIYPFIYCGVLGEPVCHISHHLHPHSLWYLRLRKI